MWRPFQVFRPNPEEDAKQARSIRDVIAASLQTLKKGQSADSFLGRKTQEPFPREEERD